MAPRIIASLLVILLSLLPVKLGLWNTTGGASASASVSVRVDEGVGGASFWNGNGVVGGVLFSVSVGDDGDGASLGSGGGLWCGHDIPLRQLPVTLLYV